jgi:hypothetical protein
MCQVPVLENYLFQTYAVIDQYNKGTITSAERNTLLARMSLTTAASFGATAAISALVASGPIGIVLGVGAVIAVALVDHFLGPLIFSSFTANSRLEEQEELEKALFQVLNL